MTKHLKSISKSLYKIASNTKCNDTLFDRIMASIYSKGSN